jgi:2'-5' RNA ligase
MDQIRSFVAIELEEDIKIALGEVQQTLRSKGIEDQVRWVKAEGMHLTLKFLGNVPADRIKELSPALTKGSERARQFRIGFRGLGCFPSLSRPNVIWVGIQGETEALVALQQGIEEHLSLLGYPPENRGYAPHLTLGRVRRNVGASQRRWLGGLIEGLEVGFLGEMPVREVSLMRSDLSPSGARYSRLALVQLEAHK